LNIHFDTIIAYSVKGESHMLIGYSKINPNDKSIYKHIEALVKIGIDMRNIYQDKITDNKNERTKLDKMLQDLQEGDIVVITELAKLCCNVKELVEITGKIRSKQANIVSLKEEWFNTTQAGKQILEILTGIVEFEKDLLSEKTKIGLATAKENGKAGGRPKKKSKDVDEALKLYRSKNHTVKEIEEMTGVSKATLYRYLKTIEKDNG
jgi:DNA invertase Pin-like site-specific DNA recombinase